MKNRKNNKWMEIMALAWMLPSLALAQGGNQGSGSHGGGEDGEFKKIRTEIQDWVDKNVKINQLEEKLKLTNLTGSELQEKFTQATKDVGEKVIFNHDPIIFGNNVRICKNENKTITCNIDEWKSSSGKTKYMIVFHEYLGSAGIETNVETDYSRYPITPEILKFVHSRESFELGMEESVTPINYHDVKTDFSAIFSPAGQKSMNAALENEYGIPFQFLSQPDLIDHSGDGLQRTYRISVLDERETTGESMAFLNCHVDVTLQFYSPREEWQKQMQDQQKLQETQRREQETAQRAQQMSTGQQLQPSNDRHIEQLVNQQLEQKRQQELQRDQQDAQQRQQNENVQQRQQQQAQAPIPEQASKIIEVKAECQLTKGKGFFLSDEEFKSTKLYQYALKHRMIQLNQIIGI